MEILNVYTYIFYICFNIIFVVEVNENIKTNVLLLLSINNILLYRYHYL